MEQRCPYRFNFNPRSPHGERRCTLLHLPSCNRISIHAPRTGSDGNSFSPLCRSVPFQSTLPARGATNTLPLDLRTTTISIHAPRTGSDSHQRPHQPPEDGDFNPRSPHGERRSASAHTRSGDSISIHAPRTGSDAAASSACHSDKEISIHAPRTGSDKGGNATRHADAAFQSTLPARGATKTVRVDAWAVTISIHAPRTGSDRIEHFPLYLPHKFQSTLPARGATDFFMCWTFISFRFQSTLPARGATLCLNR